jgi:hypothetical protein
MYAVITIAINVTAKQPFVLPLPGMTARAISESLEIIAMACDKSEGTMYIKVTDTQVRERE